ncbi:DUF5683 domain-containing protein [Prolixibacteraceae bacterium Z1-6]|uniref:DUF5683 domain-containing protein n=1 Tax=Draconibacterium aestuarii TaxID=2998507 RepID=A0A9X3F4N4_9BACT|nr:DUF5683 domain-containing protein [Prolixibacteraceae bacterium Z1-6]
MIAGRIFPKILLILLPFFFGLHSNGQIVDIDSTRIVEANMQTEVKHSAHKASLYSAIIPGWGQAYNKKYWKIPLVYAGFATIGYFIHWNNDNYGIMKQAYSDLTDGDENTNSHLDLKYADYYDLTNPTDYENFKTNLNRQQTYYRRNRDLLVISIIGFYGLNIIDASVDAHFFDFNISEDLSFNWQPIMYYDRYQPVIGVNCTFTF